MIDQAGRPLPGAMRSVCPRADFDQPVELTAFRVGLITGARNVGNRRVVIMDLAEMRLSEFMLPSMAGALWQQRTSRLGADRACSRRGCGGKDARMRTIILTAIAAVTLAAAAIYLDDQGDWPCSKPSAECALGDFRNVPG